MAKKKQPAKPARARGRPQSAPDQSTLAGLLGARIRAAREAKRLDMATFAGALGVPESTAYNWEMGRALPPIDRAMEICAVLGVPIGDLVAAK